MFQFALRTTRCLCVFLEDRVTVGLRHQCLRRGFGVFALMCFRSRFPCSSEQVH